MRIIECELVELQHVKGAYYMDVPGYGLLAYLRNGTVEWKDYPLAVCEPYKTICRPILCVEEP